MFVNHGDDIVCDVFAKRLHDELGIPSMTPFSGTVYDLKTNTCVLETQELRRRRG